MSHEGAAARLPWWFIERKDMLVGALMFFLGDSASMLIAGEWSWPRALLVGLAGGTLYAWEITRWFRLIARWVPTLDTWRDGVARTLLTLAYFNPIWILRHSALIAIGVWISAGIPLDWLDMSVASVQSFGLTFVLAFTGNWIIQTKLALRWRFIGAAIFSAIMAMVYGLLIIWL